MMVEPIGLVVRRRAATAADRAVTLAVLGTVVVLLAGRATLASTVTVTAAVVLLAGRAALTSVVAVTVAGTVRVLARLALALTLTLAVTVTVVTVTRTATVALALGIAVTVATLG